MTTRQDPREVLAAFAIPGGALECRPLPGGHINQTWRAGPWILQRLNPEVFPEGRRVMENVLAVTRRLTACGGAPPLTPELVPTRDGEWWHVGRDGALWRVFAYVPGHTFETAPSPAHAESAARAFGTFARLVSDPPLQLHTVLPHFHDTRRRLVALDSAALRDASGRSAAARPEIESILREAELAAVIPALLESGSLPVRAAHNDAKLANVIFAADSVAALAVIDLDTTMPGSPLHDFGDLVRSIVSAASEDAGDPASVAVRPDYFAGIARGFLAGTDGLLTDRERSLLVTAARATALEQAARFLTDHLDGDRYYAVASPGQNLVRARAQLALFRGLSHAAERLESLVERAA
jgi:Ser/Thr protein kinase RdoA (MazF antagonist)